METSRPFIPLLTFLNCLTSQNTLPLHQIGWSIYIIKFYSTSPLWIRFEVRNAVLCVGRVFNYLSTVLGFGHSHEQLHDRLRLGNQWSHHMNDCCELGVWLDTWIERLGHIRGKTTSESSRISSWRNNLLSSLMHYLTSLVHEDTKSSAAPCFLSTSHH